MELNPIGIIHTPNSHAPGTPLQPCFAGQTPGTLEVFEPYAQGLKDLEEFERVWLLFWCHRTVSPQMVVVPYRCDRPLGLFSTRAPARPNPIGLSCVRLLGIEGGTVRVEGVDMLDGSPLLDIKPYIPQYDVYEVNGLGWMGNGDCKTNTRTADARFEKQD